MTSSDHSPDAGVQLSAASLSTALPFHVLLDGELRVIGLGSAYDVDVKGVVGSLTLRYEITAFDEPTRFVAEARSATLTSVDPISVAADCDGSTVTYDAELTLNGLLGLANQRQ